MPKRKKIGELLFSPSEQCYEVRLSVPLSLMSEADKSKFDDLIEARLRLIREHFLLEWSKLKSHDVWR
jgi:hypothetical protein